MAEKPILFNTPMVKAILEGRKTQTRRTIKGLPLYEPFFEVDEGRGWMEDKGNGTFYALEAFSKVQPGDILWVRETWCNVNTIEYPSYFYKADNNRPRVFDFIQWRPSIHMLREAARIFLKVKDVRAERLQSITVEEIKAEGLTSAAVHVGDKEIAFEEFKLLWNSTIKKDDLKCYGWDANPWVWVYEFERI